MSNAQYVGAPSFEQGLRTPNYVNGRLLTAEDLKAEQGAMLARVDGLGQAVGHGVVEGLQVAPGGAEVTIEPGSGINRAGHLIRLPGRVILPIAPPVGGSAPRDDAARFTACGFQAQPSSEPLPSGAYLLTVLPASRLEERIASSEVSSGRGSASQWQVEGLQFKAVPLTGFDAILEDAPADRRNARAQNLLAHWCFGSEALPGLAVDPFRFGDDYGGLDRLGPPGVTRCDLPLAVFRWTGTTLAFVDEWSARRRLVRPEPTLSWRGLLSDKRVAEGHARFLQFQQQLGELVRQAATTGAAIEHFRFLPPVGFLPLGPQQQIPELRREGGPAGIDLSVFFGDFMPERLTLVDRETVDYTLQRSWYDEAIDLDLRERGMSAISLFVVRENLDSQAQPYVMFVKEFQPPSPFGGEEG